MVTLSCQKLLPFFSANPQISFSTTKNKAEPEIVKISVDETHRRQLLAYLLFLDRYFPSPIKRISAADLLKGYLANRHQLTPFIIKRNHKIIATGELCRQNPSIGVLYNLFVHPDYRGRGLGSLLSKTLLEEAKKQGFTHLVLFAKPDAIEFHRKMGFKTSWEQKDIDGMDVNTRMKFLGTINIYFYHFSIKTKLYPNEGYLMWMKLPEQTQ